MLVQMILMTHLPLKVGKDIFVRATLPDHTRVHMDTTSLWFGTRGGMVLVMNNPNFTMISSIPWNYHQRYIYIYIFINKILSMDENLSIFLLNIYFLVCWGFLIPNLKLSCSKITFFVLENNALNCHCYTWWVYVKHHDPLALDTGLTIHLKCALSYTIMVFFSRQFQHIVGIKANKTKST